MSVQNYWSKYSKSERSRFFIRKLSKNQVTDDIFKIPIENQPIFVIDNTFSDGKRHFVVESKNQNINHLSKRFFVNYDVALLEIDLKSNIKTTTLLVDFFDINNIKIKDLKIIKNIFLGSVEKIREEITAPENTFEIKIKIFINATNKVKIAYSGFCISNYTDEILHKSSKDKSKLVTMTVFNNFKNDTRVLREARAIKELGFRVRILALSGKGLPQMEIIEGIEVIRHHLDPWHLKLIRISRNLPLSKFFEKILRMAIMPWHRYLMFLEFDKIIFSKYKNEFSDVYHAHDLNTLRVAERLSSIQKSKLIYDSHELYLDRNRHKKANLFKKAIIKSFERKRIRKSDCVITVNESIANLLCERYNIKDVKIITNTPPIQLIEKYSQKYDLRKLLSIGNDKKILIYVGSIQRNRGIENLLLSLKYLDNIHLVLMGYGNKELMDELVEITKENNLEDRFSTYGPVPSELVPRYTASADIGAAPILNSCLSYYLCSPNKVFEYIHAGIPVIASNFPELSKVVLGNKIGEVFDPYDPKNIAKSINNLLDNDALRAKMIKNVQNASRIYNWNNESRKLQEIYMNLFDNEEIVNEKLTNSTIINAMETEFFNPWMEEEITKIEIENLMPGEKSWGVPKNKESEGDFSCRLNSNLFNEGEYLKIFIDSSQDLDITCKVYRIGHYQGCYARKVFQKNNIIIYKNEKWTSGIAFDKFTKKDSEVLSLKLDDTYNPGTYVMKIISDGKMMILPFWIHHVGKILTVVPTIGNKIHDYPRNSDFIKSLYSEETNYEVLLAEKIDLMGPFINSRGGNFSKWVVPFCSWSEKNNLDIAWITDEYLDNNPGLAQKYDKIVLIGNSRFWTEGLHKIFGEHISNGGIIINLGSGMGEQLVKFDKENNIVIDISNSNYSKINPIRSEWSKHESPIRFGGISQISLPLRLENNLEVNMLKMIGSWDEISENISEVNKKDIFSFIGERGDGEKIKITSSELYMQSGGMIFHSSIDNWSSVLIDTEGSDYVKEIEEMRNHIHKLLKNSIQIKKDPIKIRKMAMESLIMAKWDGVKISKNNLIKIRENRCSKIKKLCFLSAIWKRPGLTKAFLEYLNLLREEMEDLEIECVIVGSEGENTRKLVERYNFHYVESENLPLSKKWDSGLNFTKDIDADAVIILGSDDFLSKRTIRKLCESIEEGRLMVGLMDMHIFNAIKSKLYHWKGYRGSKPNRQWETIGMARCLSKKLLEKVNYSFWSEEEINNGLDGLMTRKMADLGLIPIPYGEEVWMNIDNEAYAFGHVGIHTTDFSGFAVDIKTNENITSLERYSMTKDDLEYKNMIKEELGEKIFNTIMRNIDEE